MAGPAPHGSGRSVKPSLNHHLFGPLRSKRTVGQVWDCYGELLVYQHPFTSLLRRVLMTLILSQDEIHPLMVFFGPGYCYSTTFWWTVDVIT